MDRETIVELRFDKRQDALILQAFWRVYENIKNASKTGATVLEFKHNSGGVADINITWHDNGIIRDIKKELKTT